MAKRALGLEEIAAEVGRLFGTTEKHARKWLEQRKQLLDALSTVRDHAGALMKELGGEGPFPWPKATRRKRKKAGTPVVQPGMRESRKKRVVSAVTKAKMREAARKRWAGLRKRTKGMKSIKKGFEAGNG